MPMCWTTVFAAPLPGAFDAPAVVGRPKRDRKKIAVRRRAARRR
jgi:hypothetical protein